MSPMRSIVCLLAMLAAGTAQAVEWPTYAGGPRRLFFNPAETQIASE
jgi:hypothetical protein